MFIQAADTEAKFQAQARVLDRLRVELETTNRRWTLTDLERLLREEGVTP